MKKIESIKGDLKKANKRLKEAASLKSTQIHRDATIQRFEFCFELAWKAVQTYVRDQGLECRSPRNCFRTGAQLNIIEDPLTWFEYLESRNLIAHTYNEKLADKVYRQAKKFPKDVESLIEKMEKDS